MRRTIHTGIAIFVILLLIFVSVPVNAQGTTTVTHTVQPGENLYRISLRYGVTVQAIVAANAAVTNPNLILVGQTLAIPGGVDGGASGSQPPGDTGGETLPPQTYTVVAGDTLSKIARQFNTTVQAIAQMNNIANVNLILIGQQLQIPGGTPGPVGTGDEGVVAGPPGETGGFELGGHSAHFGNFTEMQQADMTWVKVQIRYHPGDNADITAPSINAAHLAGFKILLSIVGEVDDLAAADYNTYTDEFAEFLGGVALLGPEAVEVWNEQNLDREWPNGRIDPAAYTTMLQKAHAAIKAVNQDIMVISGAPAPTGGRGSLRLGSGMER